jgi:small subunit ribosomal protein S2
MRDITLEELLEAGCHFGHQKRRWNPLMKRYIYGERDGVHIFDLAKTKLGLEKACEYVSNLVANGGLILFVGTKRQAADYVKNEAIRVGMPYVSVRWMGGLLTNTSNLSKRIRKLADMKAKREAGEYKIYTKKERLLLDREIEHLEKFFGGVSAMEGLPNAMFVVDTHKEEVAVREGVRVGIPVVGIVDTNSNPDMVNYVIPANDDAVKSIELIVTAIAEAVVEGKKKAIGAEAKTKSKKEEKVEDIEVPEVAEKIEEKAVEKEVKKEIIAKTKKEKK